ncbi:MAG: hypothetical protein AAFT19_04420 [Pseudomonadota bacterium]
MAETRQFLSQIAKKVDDANTASTDAYRRAHVNDNGDKGRLALENDGRARVRRRARTWP